jgi:hypothetical protein
MNETKESKWARLSASIAYFTDCASDGCTYCCHGKDDDQILVSIEDQPLHQTMADIGSIVDGTVRLTIYSNGNCSFLSSHGCGIHPSAGGKVQWATDCKIYPFFPLTDGRIIIMGTCAHTSRILQTMNDGSDEVEAHVATIYELLHELTPADMRHHYDEMVNEDSRRYNIVLNDPR